MGYSIRYGAPMPGEERKGFSFGVFLISLVIFSAIGIRIFLPGKISAWADGIAPQAEQTWQAVQAMAQQVEDGKPFGEVFSNFCRDVIVNAQTNDEA